MDRALRRDDLTLALGELPQVPSPDELQRLLADAELSLFAASPQIPDELVRTGWYLHAIASTGADRIEWARRAAAFRISAHILELAAKTDRPTPERLDCLFGSELGYRRGGLDPNATAVFASAHPVLDMVATDGGSWRPTLAVEAAIYLLSFHTSQTFQWLNTCRENFRRLRGSTSLDDLAGTMFGPAEHVVEACHRLLRFLMFGDRSALVQAQGRLRRLLGPDGDPATIDEQWVAAHLLGLSGELDAASVWTSLPPDVPDAARRALTSTSPPVLTLWEPQRELFAANVDNIGLLSGQTRRAILSVPTSAGKTLVAQILVLTELARGDHSVCLVAPQRSLVREIRRALLPRVRALRKRLSPDVPDFLADFAADLLDEEPSDVDVMTPERFAALLRADPDGVLNRYGLFIFDEAHLVGDRGRGFTLEGALSYLHWRTRDTDHRIILMSAAIGNDAAFYAWLSTDQPVTPFSSQWRGPRRLTAAFRTDPDWDAERHLPPVGRGRLHRLSYPLNGIISFTVPGAGARSFATTEPIGTLVFKRTSQGTRGPKDERSSRHYEHVAALASFLEHAGPVLTVTGTRPDAQRLASALASERAVAPPTRRARDAVAAILDADHPLVHVLERGVGYHHAGLPLEVLSLVEDELRAGRLQHLVSTTTLTEGVNLPVHTVVLAEIRWDGSDIHLSGPRMLNAIGRAGRAGIETEGWVVFAPSGRAPSNPERHLPNPDELLIRSKLSTDAALEGLVEFERRRSTAADAVFSDLPESLQEFTTFVWYVLACEEALSNAVDDDQLDDIIDTLFVARQVGAPALDQLRRYARDVRTTYQQTDPTRRRAWARSGTRIASAKRIDHLARVLADRAQHQLFRGSVRHAIAIFDQSDVLDELLLLPDVPEDTWRFRTTPQGVDVEVDLGDALRRWTSGEPLAVMAEALLADVPHREWRLEQMVDRVSRGFGHSISWMIATVLERANAILTEGNLEPICPALALYARFGVDSPVALQLITRSLRSREVAVRVAQAAADEGVADEAVAAWLTVIPIEQWPHRFAARPSDVLDLLDAISDPQGEILRRLLDGETVELEQSGDVEPGAVILAVEQDSEDIPLVSITKVTGEHVAMVGSQWQADLRTVLATGVNIAAEVTAGKLLVVRRRDT